MEKKRRSSGQRAKDAAFIALILDKYDKEDQIEVIQTVLGLKHISSFSFIEPPRRKSGKELAKE